MLRPKRVAALHPRRRSKPESRSPVFVRERGVEWLGVEWPKLFVGAFHPPRICVLPWAEVYDTRSLVRNIPSVLPYVEQRVAAIGAGVRYRRARWGITDDGAVEDKTVPSSGVRWGAMALWSFDPIGGPGIREELTGSHFESCPLIWDHANVTRYQFGIFR
jgi:hypothetical protein